MASKAQIRASNKYNKDNTVQLPIRLNKKTDADILEKLEHVRSKSGFIKQCIRKNMKSCDLGDQQT